MTPKEVAEILASHNKWLRGEGGVRANLSGANLSGARLSGANLCKADLSFANLSVAYCYRTNLYRANLHGANCFCADLAATDLHAANFFNASLTGTVLDPEREPNGDVEAFEIVDGCVIGYRTRRAGHIDQYRDGRFYSADVFSTCPRTQCHPGLYLWPGYLEALAWSPGQPIIKVRTRPSEVHRVAGKYRCRWFEVLGEAEEQDANGK